MSIGEVQALFNVCAQDESIKGIRDAALIAVLYSAGLRRSEVVMLDLSDWEEADNCLIVRSGKGDKDRTNYLDNGAKAALTECLRWRGDEPGALFYPTRKGGSLEKRRMSDQAVLDILQGRGKEANLTSFSPHDFRRTFASNMIDAGVDIVTVQNLMGHASPVTTARYDRRSEAAKRKAAILLHTSCRRLSLYYKLNLALMRIMSLFRLLDSIVIATFYLIANKFYINLTLM